MAEESFETRLRTARANVGSASCTTQVALRAVASNVNALTSEKERLGAKQRIHFKNGTPLVEEATEGFPV